MAYAAWSVVFGEQPSAAKWNILGTNDSTFNTLLGTYGVRNPYCFRAYASGATTLADGASTDIAFATEDYDYNNNFASSTYTAPVAGVYHFDACFTYATAISTGVIANCRIIKGGALALTGTSSVPVTNGAYSVSGDLLLAQGDTIKAAGYHDSAGAEDVATGSTQTWFSGHLVHAV